MSQPSPSSAGPTGKPTVGPPASVLLVPYPKIVFLYPTFLLAIVAAFVMNVVGVSADAPSKAGTFISILFLGLLAVNLVILSFDFPRTTSLTLFFFAAAAVMACILLFKYKPELLPAVHRVLAAFHPLANATFYWSVAAILGGIFIAVLIVVRFDYWEVRPTNCCTITASSATWSGSPPPACGWKKRSTTSSSTCSCNPAG